MAVNMVITLSNLTSATGSRHRSKRLGRGPGSGRGTTAGRGTKGQRARSGGRKGLQRMGLKRIMQRIPKHRGFKSIHPKPTALNVGDLEARLIAGALVTPAYLVKNGIIKHIQNGVKILGDGALTKPFVIKGCAVSKKAKEKIEKAGGKIGN